VQLNATIQRDATGLPQVQVLSCAAAVSTLNIQIGGGVVQWIVNLFNGAIAGKLQTLIQTGVCTAAQGALLKYANEKLRYSPQDTLVQDKCTPIFAGSCRKQFLSMRTST
jgi:hypothetical protein